MALFYDSTPTIALEKKLTNLFKSGHLQIIHVNYFGPKDVDIEKQIKHPFEKVLFDALPKRDMMMDESIESYPIKNLWSNKLRYTRLLNRVVTVLLRVHLAPKSERLRREKKGKQSTESLTGSFKMSYNRRKRLFRNENIKHEKHLQKVQIGRLNENKWLSKVQKSDMHIAKYKELLQKERTTVNPRTTLPAMSDGDEAATLEIAAVVHPIAAQEVIVLEDEVI
ncbi:hypothetical protein BCV72DRAFT_320918 [Rhizopus microsporus var. microsporus]|uniref:Uncharacterized protein n=2 Tax=Rhizopus microsporus TaxID=58291 RepID=A0A2G4SPX0_RHIZD|nr:uncharacterized protein RHIMIDRAFT_244707 [Rhizopus microsporus ATCC 52813]ORE01584.1 hypothetical protein BCV72DRAFT_320918 [Rhizopus microsporus var. microsporus]PHZ10824.1 hypothetical protein RHIMIDRAFT_244707 [Rhizopus microsporus ATCC 52813]